MKTRRKIPRHCGACQQIYTPEGGVVGQTDLEGIMIRIDGRDIPGENLNICKNCAMKALLGTKPFRRRKNVVFL